MLRVQGLPIHDNSCKALKELGIESDFFSSSDICDLDTENFDLVIGMTEEHIKELENMEIPKDKLRLLNAENGGVTDPYGGNIETYRRCRDIIIKSLGEIFTEL